MAGKREAEPVREPFGGELVDGELPFDILEPDIVELEIAAVSGDLREAGLMDEFSSPWGPFAHVWNEWGDNLAA